MELIVSMDKKKNKSEVKNKPKNTEKTKSTEKSKNIEKIKNTVKTRKTKQYLPISFICLLKTAKNSFYWNFLLTFRQKEILL